MTVRQVGRPVAPTDHVNDVLERDGSLLEVFVRHAPQFDRLRNRAMRRVMGRLVTVEQAARIAGIPVEGLLHDLNGALGMDRVSPVSSARVAADAPSPERARRHPSSAAVVEVDVREDLRAGREPFGKIMASVAALRQDQVLLVRTIFEPVPLIAMLTTRGFDHEGQAHASDDWSLWFWRGQHHSLVEQPHTEVWTRELSNAVPAATVWLDVRGLDPPEPLMRTLAALDTLPAGHQLVQMNTRVPRLLFPMLVERGYACEVDESHVDKVLVRIWHSTPA